jgi:hypothetical protein
MRHFLGAARASMASSRRTETTPQDFVAALAAARLRPAHLLPFATLPADAARVAQPALRPAPPPSADEAPPDTGALLAVLGDGLAANDDDDTRSPTARGAAADARAGGGKARRRRATRGRFVPRQMPPFPSRHAWQATAVFPGMAAEASKMAMRERATEEGVLAERALRRLTETTRKMMRRQRAGSGGSAAAAAGAGDGDTAMGGGLEVVVAEEAPPVTGRSRGELERAWEAALQAAVRLDEEAERERAAALDAGFEDEDDAMMGGEEARPPAAASFAALEDGASVNYDHRFWRDAASIF